MNKVLISHFFLSLFFLSIRAEEPNTDQPISYILRPTNETFNELLASNEHVFVLFYREDRAGRLYLQAFENLARDQQAGNASFPNKITFAAIDLATSIPLRASQNLTRFPLLRMYIRNNKTILYEGGRSEEIIRKWLVRQFKEVSSPIKEVKTIAELQELVLRKNILMVYFGPKYVSNHETFLNMADKYPYYNYAFGFSVEIFDAFLNEKYNEGRFVCFNNDEQEDYTLEFIPPLKKSTLKSFFEGCAHRSYFNIDFETAERLFKGHESFMILAIDSTSNESLRARGVYKESKPLLAGKMLLTIFDSKNNDTRLFNYMENLFQITPEDVAFLPSLVLIDREASNGVTIKYKYIGGIYNDTVEAFYKSWKQKKIPVFYKSHPKSLTDPDEGRVKSINHQEFVNLVINGTKNAFIMVYSDDCGACKNFRKVFGKIAEKYREIDSLEFFMINGVSNDIMGIDLIFVPSFYLFKNGEKDKPIYMSDHKEEERFHEFLKENLLFDREEERDEL